MCIPLWLKKKIIDKLFLNQLDNQQTFNISVHNSYKIVNMSSFKTFIKNSKFVISPKYPGINYLMVFFKFDNLKFAGLINKTDILVLAKQREHNNFNININIRMVKLHYELDDTIFNGTVFDGIYCQNGNYSINQGTYYLNNVYLFRGQNYEDFKLSFKLQEIQCYFNAYLKKMRQTRVFDNLNVQITQYQCLEHFQENNIPLWFNQYDALIFQPQIKNNISDVKNRDNNGYNIIKSRTSFIVCFSNIPNFKEVTVQKVSINEEGNGYSESLPSVPELQLNFLIDATNLPDVYVMNVLNPVEELQEGKQKYAKIQVGFLHIKKLADSQLIAGLMAANHNIITCKFINGDWHPVGPGHSRPALISEFLNKKEDMEHQSISSVSWSSS